MMPLFLAEFRRFYSRRAVRAAGLLVVAAVAVAGVLVFANSQSSSAAVTAAKQQHQRFVDDCVRSHERSGPGAIPPEFESVEEFCAEITPLAVLDPRFYLVGLPDILLGLSPLIIILGLGLGATFIGAEWSAGTITTLLTWEPRRVRVLLIKLAAGGIFVWLAALLAQASLALGLTPAAAFRGSLEGVDVSWVAETLLLAARSSTVAGLAACIGFSLAAVARNTGASLIFGFVYFAVLENIIRAFRPNWTRWLVGENAALFVAGRDDTAFLLAHSETRAIVTLAAYVLVLAVVSTAVFQRRDVT